MARLVPALGAVLLLLVLAAAPAGAASRVVPLDMEPVPDLPPGNVPAGPALAFDSAFWAQPRPDGRWLRFSIGGPLTQPRYLGPLPPSSRVVLGAGGTHAILARQAQGQADEILSGPANAQNLSRVDGCTGVTPACPPPGSCPRSVASALDAIAWGPGCSGPGLITVFTFGTGETMTFEGETVDLAGRFRQRGRDGLRPAHQGDRLQPVRAHVPAAPVQSPGGRQARVP